MATPAAGRTLAGPSTFGTMSLVKAKASVGVRGAVTELRFGVGPSWLGTVLVAATSRGVCGLLLGETPATLIADLQRRFANATLIEGGPDFAPTLADAVALVEHPHRTNTLTLDCYGTAFQLRVWRALQELAPGSTTNYAALAAAIGKPTAARAVAQACGANAVAVAIPCHRVVQKAGGIAGYRWGVARKQMLLAREAMPGASSVKP